MIYNHYTFARGRDGIGFFTTMSLDDCIESIIYTLNELSFLPVFGVHTLVIV